MNFIIIFSSILICVFAILVGIYLAILCCRIVINDFRWHDLALTVIFILTLIGSVALLTNATNTSKKVEETPTIDNNTAFSYIHNGVREDNLKKGTFEELSNGVIVCSFYREDGTKVYFKYNEFEIVQFQK